MRFLLDTNVISELRKSKPHGAVLAWFRATPPEDLAVPAVALGELQAGAELTRLNDSGKALEIETWIEKVASTFQVVPMDGDCFREWARLMHGQSDSLYEDAMIAATARIQGLTIATRDERDLSHFDVRLFNPFRYSA
jgi:predicted nucleic acid-binding protein